MQKRLSFIYNEGTKKAIFINVNDISGYRERIYLAAWLARNHPDDLDAITVLEFSYHPNKDVWTKKDTFLRITIRHEAGQSRKIIEELGFKYYDKTEKHKALQNKLMRGV